MDRNRMRFVRSPQWLIAVCGIAAYATIVQPCSAGDAVGWRRDGQGEFPAAVAPTRWSRETGIAWKVELPATSLASPIVIGERVFVMAEPNRLMCLQLSNGETLWERTHEYEDIFGADKAAEIRQKHAESQKVQQEIAKVEKQLKSAQDADPKSADVTALQDQIRRLRERDEELTSIPPPRTDATGNTASTPAGDEENVYAVLGNGIVSSHRLNGERNWIQFVGKPMSRHSASPLIVGELLIVHLQQLTALNAKTGAVVWTAETPARNGTPVVLTVGDRALIVTPAGAIVRSADGNVLAKDLFNLAYCSPIVREGVIYAAERGRLLAIEVSPGEDADAIETRSLWLTKGTQDDHLASPVIHEGLLFSATGSGILEVFDAATGKMIQRKRLELGQGRVDASLSLVNNLLYIQSTNGTTAILEPTSDCREVARNEAEGSSSSPFFVDEQMLSRTRKHLICVGGEREE